MFFCLLLRSFFYLIKEHDLSLVNSLEKGSISKQHTWSCCEIDAIKKKRIVTSSRRTPVWQKYLRQIHVRKFMNESLWVTMLEWNVNKNRRYSSYSLTHLLTVNQFCRFISHSCILLFMYGAMTLIERIFSHWNKNSERCLIKLKNL